MITAEQRQLRKGYIGSSDAAAIMGLDEYRSPADVWLEKTGQADDFEGNANTERGNLLEPVLVNWAEAKLSAALIRDLMKVSDCGLLAANYDGIQPSVHNGGGDGPGPGGVNDEPFIVEAKTSNNPDEWGADGTDEVPDRVLIQTHHAMYVAGPKYRVAYVPVLLPGYRSFDFRLYRVVRSDDLADTIASRGREFMRDYVQTGRRPDDFKPSLEVLKRMRRQPKKVVPVSDELVDALVVARAVKKRSIDDCEDAEAAMVAALGDAEGGTYSKGEITYLQTTRKGYAVEPVTFRTLRVKAQKD
jgi:putative phage-type endonuclease